MEVKTTPSDSSSALKSDAGKRAGTPGAILYWAPPTVLVIFAALIVLTDANHALFTLINQWYHYTGEKLWANFTSLADTLVALVLFLPLCGRRPDILRALVITAIVSTLWVHGFKAAVGLPRPAAVLPAGEIHIIGPVLHMGSFPSGHTATAFTAAALCCLMIRNRALILLLITLASMAGLSRIVVGAHWPLDVVAGAFVGWVSAIIGIRLAEYWHAGCGLLAQRCVAVLLLLCAGRLIIGYDTHYPYSAWLLYLIGVTCPLLAIPGLSRLWRGRTS